MSHFGVASDLSLGRPSSTLGQPIIAQRPLLSQLESPNNFHPYLTHLEFYVKALEDERHKLDAFKRELPICMQLLDEAIEASRDQLANGLASPLTPFQITACASSDCMQKTSLPTEKRGIDEIMMWKGNWDKKVEVEDECKIESRTWNKSLELDSPEERGRWSLLKKETSPNKCIKLELEQNASTFESEIVAKANEMGDIGMRTLRHAGSSPYEALNGINGSPMGEDVKEQETLCALETDPKGMAADILEIRKEDITPGGASGRTNSTSSQQPRKARRCWSPELHQRFLHALRQLGGPQVATPKQIRQLMSVEGLTNDEVKSHLQKFRLHTRRPIDVAAQAADQQTQHGPHLVVFGGIWVPPDYAGTHSSSPSATAEQAMGNIYDVAPGHAVQRPTQISPSLLSHATNEYNAYFHSHRRTNLVCQNLMQEQPMQPTFSQLEAQDYRMEVASEEDVARSESTSLNGENGRGDDQEEEDTEIHLGSGGQMSLR